MGRGLILFLVGMFIMMGMYSFSSQQRLISSQDDMAQQVYYSLTSSTAMSALENAGQRLVLNDNPNFKSHGDELKYKVDDSDVTVLMERTGNIITLTSIAVREGISSQIIGRYRLDANGNMPSVHGAMGIYSTGLKFNMTGSAFEINGCDHEPQVSTPISCDDTYGIAVHSEANRKIVYDEITGANKGGDRSDLVIGNAPPSGSGPSIGLIDSDGEFIDNAKKAFLDLANSDQYEKRVISSDAIAVDNGRRDHPAIIHVTNGATYTVSGDNEIGSGVIIVDPGAEIHMAGNFHYEGLIIVQGTFNVARGNLTLYGALLFGGANPEVEVQTIDYRGNIHIRYSSEVLDTLDERLSGSSGARRLVLLEQYQ